MNKIDNYDDLKADRHDQLRMIVSVTPIEVTETNTFNIVESDTYSEDYIKNHVRIDVDKREICFSFKYRDISYVYPEGTTHFIYPEFSSESDYITPRPFPVKLEDDLSLSYRFGGIWVNTNKKGDNTFKDDSIKSINDLIEDQKNPRLRVKHNFYHLIGLYSKNPYTCDDESKNYLYFAEIIHNFNVSLLEMHIKDLYGILDLRPSYDEFIKQVSLLKPGGDVLAVSLNKCRYFKNAYNEMLIYGN